ncbi:transporter substrate-binding domain-containing protein [Aliiroseovarius sp. 2305UL8-7]|uniref:transporter substrate-binding domain-containing protein n=1 Tax=Aliiroseovarius conchicola TaxID=3121637 RepID=UPI003526FE27
MFDSRSTPRLVVAALLLWASLGTLMAQDRNLTFATIERPPFSIVEDGEITGFSIELMRAIAFEMNLSIDFELTQNFPDMLKLVEGGGVDGAIANISITRDREARMDFTQPIYSGGLQIMVPAGQGQISVWRTLFSWDIALAILAAFAILFGGGMLMWAVERGRQPYFDLSAREAMFPSFWWALNLVVNGGFEERMPRSAFGRFFGTILVISSLFIVSVFVAHITAKITVDAISGSIHSVTDLDGKRVGTTEGSTAARFLTDRGVNHIDFASFGELVASFEEGELDAVVFDGPILSHYVQNDGAWSGQMLNSVFQPENYGIALPAGSPLREEINVALLRLIETGAYRDLSVRWFGSR